MRLVTICIENESSAAAAEPTPRRLRVWLTVENNSKFVRGKKKAWQSIEQFCLARYGMKRGARANEYEIIVSYGHKDELHHVIEDLQQEISWRPISVIVLRKQSCKRSDRNVSGELVNSRGNSWRAWKDSVRDNSPRILTMECILTQRL